MCFRSAHDRALHTGKATIDLYTPDAIAQLYGRLSKIQPDFDELRLRFLTRSYRTEPAKEFTTHGFLRRVSMLEHCIDRIFQTCPPESKESPENLSDTTLFIQAFIFNLFGALDNLAWIWVSERGVTKPDGEELSRGMVGFGPKCKFVRRSLSPEFRAYLESIKGWFDEIEGFRHGLAHRIPLYVPPYVVPRANHERFDELQDQINAAIASRRHKDYDRLSAEQNALGHFSPVMKHSYTDSKTALAFHSQILHDWVTLREAAHHLLRDLDTID